MKSLLRILHNFKENFSHRASTEEIALIKKTNLFAHLNEKQFNKLLHSTSLIKYAAGKLILEEGKQVDDFYIIVKGSVRVFAWNDKAKKISLAKLNRGDFFGTEALLGQAHKTRNANIEAITDVIILKISENFISTLLNIDIESKKKLQNYGFNQSLGLLSESSSFSTGLVSIFSGIKNQRIIDLKDGEEIFKFGDKSDDVYVILEGDVKLLVPEKNKTIKAVLLHKGNLFGELSVLNEEPRIATAIAQGILRLLVINGNDFKKYLSENTQLQQVLKSLKQVYLIPNRGIIERFVSNVPNIGNVITIVYKMEDGRSIISSKLVNNDVFSMYVDKVIGGKSYQYEKGQKKIKIEVVDNHIIRIKAFGIFDDLPIMCQLLLEDEEVSDAVLAEFEITGELNLEKEIIESDPEILCEMHVVMRKQIQELIDQGISDFYSLAKETGISTYCKTCSYKIYEMLGVTPWFLATMKKIIEHTPNVNSYLLKPIRSHFTSFKPGQHVNIQVKVEGNWVERSYEISDVQHDGDIRITIKKDPRGYFTSWLFEKALDEVKVQVSQPQGDFLLDIITNEDVLCLAEDMGIAPFITYAKFLSENFSDKKLYIHYSAPMTSDFIFQDELNKITKENPNITVHHKATNSEGRLTEEDIIKIMNSLKEPDIYICGSARFVDSIKDVLQNIHYDKNKVLSEKFFDIETMVKPTNKSIVIIGMACRFPDAANYDEFWENLKAGKNSISEITQDRWDINKFYSSNRDEPNKSISKWGGLLNRIDTFDAPFFHISPREAQAMDPQQRILLEETWHCVEDAGVALHELQDQSTSVYVGVMAADYNQRMMSSEIETDSYSALGNYEGILANRLSYFFNFMGESQSIDNACASSLVALNEARRSLLNGESEYAVAAGVSVICHAWKYISFSKAHMLSPDGQCKTFDAEANGYVPGEGVGVLLLTTLENALEKGCHIYGVLKGSAVLHGGKTKSITAPRVEAQRQVIQEALAGGKVSPENITYVEAHGTGTSLGDPIEIEALTQAFHTKQKQYCHIGSVKTNIGHLEGAAGIAGAIKVLLMFQHQKIPKTLNIKTISPIINFKNSPFIPALQLSEWELPKGISTRYAGVSSFGFGGVDAHAVFEEYVSPVTEKSSQSSKIPLPFILSATTPTSLDALLKHWRQYTHTPAFKNLALEDICYTLCQGREVFPYRFAVTVQNKRELTYVLEQIGEAQKIFSDTEAELNKKSIILRLGELATLPYAEFQQLCKHYPILSKLLSECESAINKIENGDEVLSELNGSKQENYQVLRNFIMLFVLSKALLTSGVNPKYLIGKGIGKLAESVISDMIEFTIAVQCLLGMKPEIKLHRPNINFYDMQHHQMIEHYQILGEYCQLLSGKIELEEDLTEQILIKSRQLIVNQFTFKKFIGEWQDILKKYGINIETILQEDNKSLAQNQMHLVIVVLLYSIKKLNQKWDLREQLEIKNTALIELVDLLLDQALSPEYMARLLLEPNDSNFTIIAEYIHKHQADLDPKKPYFLLHQSNQTIKEITDANAWIEELINSNDFEDSLPKDILHPMYVDIAVNHSSQTQDHVSLDIFDLENTLPVFLIDLWKKGFSINWRLWNETIAYKKVSLPIYPFDEERYWIAETKPAISAVTAPEITPIEIKTPSIKAPEIGVPELETPELETPEIETPEIEKLLESSPEKLFAATAEFLKKIISDATKTNIDKINISTHFDSFGIESIMIIQLNKALEQFFGRLPATLFFKYKNIQELAQYLIEHHLDSVKNISPTAEPSAEIKIKIPENEPTLPKVTPSSLGAQEDIAIIGLSGKFPEAKNIVEFWKNLEEGRNCITEIPSERWDYKKYFEPVKDKLEIKPGKTYSKWGGFIDNVDKFDAGFFNISPKDAVFMDPQERLFLQTTWSCLESAGYTQKDTEKVRTGVFVGVTYNNYQLLFLENMKEGIAPVINSQTYSIANRISYYFDFTGPSMIVDSACSSSLNALHLACESIRRGECSLAIAGGVNLTLHPSKYSMLCTYGFAAMDGLCHSFAEGGDGYVPGEGVGAVLLKSLSLAKKDGDYIYAIIKGSAVTHDGKTNGYTVPSPVAQSEAIESALLKSGIDPRTISYIEAHGTGTSLGDPIEMTGLEDVFEKYTHDKQFSAIGSIKSNIGHLESAAGISQLMKVILQMKNKTLVPTLMHGRKLNPNIDFANSPFYVQQELSEWKTIPRRAGISSFGAGGVNVHLVLEEYNNQASALVENKDFIIPLSAKSEARLKAYAEELKDFLSKYKDKNPVTGEKIALSDLAYTLQLGRKEFSYRLALVVKNIEEVIDALNDYLNPDSTKKTNLVYQAKISDNPPQKESLNYSELGAIAQSWTQGTSIAWQNFYNENKPNHIYLPTYSFAKDRYWPTTQTTETKPAEPTEKPAQIITPSPTNEKLLVSGESTPKLIDFLLELADLPQTEQLEKLIHYCRKLLGELLGFDPSQLPDSEQGFFEMGMESLQALKLLKTLREDFNIEIPDTILFDYPNILKLAQYLLQQIPFDQLQPVQASTEKTQAKEETDKGLLLSGAIPNEIAKMSEDEVFAELKKYV